MINLRLKRRYKGNRTSLKDIGRNLVRFLHCIYHPAQFSKKRSSIEIIGIGNYIYLILIKANSALLSSFTHPPQLIFTSFTTVGVVVLSSYEELISCKSWWYFTLMFKIWILKLKVAFLNESNWRESYADTTKQLPPIT